MTSTGEQHQTQIRSFFAENLFDLNMLICSGSRNDQKTNIWGNKHLPTIGKYFTLKSGSIGKCC